MFKKMPLVAEAGLCELELAGQGALCVDAKQLSPQKEREHRA